MKSYATALLAASAAAYSTADFEKTLEGILMGAVTAELGDALACINDVETLVSEVEETVTDFKQWNLDGVSKGITMIGTIVGQATKDLQDCKTAEIATEDLYKLITTSESFSSPISFAYHVGKDILLNGTDIYAEINAAITAWDNSDWYNFGLNIGEALGQVLIGTEAEFLTVYGAEVGLTTPEIEQIVEGILMGSIELAIPSSKTCFGDVSTLATEVETAYNDFASMTISGVSHGIEEIGTIVGQINQDIADCEVSAEDAKKLAEMAKNFSSPWSFAYHVGKDLLVNGVDIFHDIENAMTAYGNADYYNFGVDIGMALEEVLVGDVNAEEFIQ